MRTLSFDIFHNAIGGILSPAIDALLGAANIGELLSIFDLRSPVGRCYPPIAQATAQYVTGYTQ